MQEPGNGDYYEPPYDEEPGSGLLGATVRNAAVLIGVCLVVAWFLGGLDSGDPGPSVAAGPAPENGATSGGGSEDTALEAPAQRLAYGGAEILVPPGPGGHFLVEVDVNGVAVRFLVDTGATTVTLTEEDALRVGLPAHALEFNARFQTANGEIMAAPVTLRDMRIGGSGVEDIRATVTRAPLNISLLGMSFLKRLAGYEVRPEGLVLRF